MIFGSKNNPSQPTSPQPAAAPAQPPAQAVPASVEVEPRTSGEALYLILSEHIRQAKPSTQMELVSAFQEDLVYDDLPPKVRRLMEAAGDELVELFGEDEDDDEDDDDDEDEDE